MQMAGMPFGSSYSQPTMTSDWQNSTQAFGSAGPRNPNMYNPCIGTSSTAPPNFRSHLLYPSPPTGFRFQGPDPNHTGFHGMQNMSSQHGYTGGQDYYSSQQFHGSEFEKAIPHPVRAQMPAGDIDRPTMHGDPVATPQCKIRGENCVIDGRGRLEATFPNEEAETKFCQRHHRSEDEMVQFVGRGHFQDRRPCATTPTPWQIEDRQTNFTAAPCYKVTTPVSHPLLTCHKESYCE